jgi:DHA3 family macrolide efflux protein-like MFS transporter
MPNEPSRLFNRHYCLLWQGQMINQLAAQVFSVAMLLWIKHATGSATAVGLMLMLSALPAALLAPIAGTFADRHSRRRIIIAGDIVLGVVSLALAGLMSSGLAATRAILTGLVVVSLSTAIANSFFSPAISAAIPDLVPRDKIAAANSLSQSSFQLSSFLGQGLGGTLFLLLGAPALLLFNGLGYLLAAIAGCLVSIPQRIPVTSDSWRQNLAAFKRDLLQGLHYVWADAGLRMLVFVSAAFNFFTIPVVVLLPFYVEDHLKVTADWYGFIVAGYGVGSLIGYASAGILRLAGRTRSGVQMILMILVESAGYVLLGVLRNPQVSLALAVLGGFAAGIVMVDIITILQLTTPGEMRGRVFGLLGAIAASLTPIAMGLSGVVADVLHRDIPLIYVICGSCTAALAVGASSSRVFRDYFRHGENRRSSPIQNQVAPSP